MKLEVKAMKSTTRHLFISIALVFLFASIAKADPGIVLESSVGQAKPGEEFTVQINIRDVSDLFAASLELEYDVALLEVISTSAGDFLGADTIFFDMSDSGSVSLAISKKAGSVSASGSGVLATVKFRGLEEGIAGISVNKDTLTLKQSDGNPVPGFDALTTEPLEIFIGYQPVLNIHPQDNQLKLGDEIKLSATVSDISELFGASFEIKYNGNMLEYVNSSPGDFMGEDVIFLDMSDSNSVSIAVSMKSGANPAHGSGVIADITFRAKGVGESEVSYRKETLNLQRLDGTYIPVAVEDANINVYPGTKGDVNGDGRIRSNDAILALRFSAGLMLPTDNQKWAADMNEDGKVRSNDAIIILRKAAGLAAPRRGNLISSGGAISLVLSVDHSVSGETVAVKLEVNKPELIAGGDICIAYDRWALELVGVYSDNDLLMVKNTSKPGKLNIAFVCMGEFNSDKLMDLRFHYTSDVSSPLIIENLELYDPNACLLNSEKIDGKFVSRAETPKQSALFQNFPNPFNPETWIPYQLGEGAEVLIQIFDASGKLLRQFDLGYKPAGLYLSQERALYWDGKNSLGESLASGVFFYRISAGEFHAVQKMTILK
jgi:hypothetical protein